jgi:uncharacterized protein
VKFDKELCAVIELMSLSADNLMSPMVLFFLLGLAAGLMRSDLAIPESISKFLALYLVLAIGFKGGVALAAAPGGAALIVPLLVAAALSAALPVVGYGLLRLSTGLDVPNAAAVAAHYGSVSVVTFVAATVFLGHRGESFEPHLFVMLAVMEAPAVIVGILLARGGRAAADSRWHVIHEAVFSGSVVLLIGSLAIGFISGAGGMQSMAPIVEQPFRGILSLFLLDMGLTTARRLVRAGGIQRRVVLFGLYMPLVGASLGLLCGGLLGLSTGGVMLLAVLVASASYIVVPAAVRMAIPQADPAIYMTLALGITFPFNVILGIPLYYAAARLVVP